MTVKLKLLVLSLAMTGTLAYHHLQICKASELKNMRSGVSIEKHMRSGISLGKLKKKLKIKKIIKKNPCASFSVEFSIFF